MERKNSNFARTWELPRWNTVPGTALVSNLPEPHA